MANSTPSTDAQLARQARLRVDLLVIPCLLLMFVFLQFDRTSLGNALTDNFARDIRVSQKEINTGQTLFTLGIVLFEIPCNIAIKRCGAHRWLPALMFCWGTVTWCQMFLTNRSSFWALRFLLAAFEAGFIPGAAFYLGQFYTRREMAFRYTLLWAANSIAGALAGVLALGLLSLSGRGGLHGWQWLFLIEGVLTCIIAVLAALHLPAGVTAATVHPIGSHLPGRPAILTSHQAATLDEVISSDDATKYSQRSRTVHLRDFDLFADWKIWGHCVMAFLSSIMFTPINTYGPSIIKSLGYKGYTANGLNSVGSVLALIVSLSLGYSSDRTRERGLHVTAGFALAAVGCLWLALPPLGVAQGVLYAGLVVVQGTMGCVQGTNAAWLSQNLQERQRPIGLASYVMSIQLASFVGANIFTAADAPRYRRPLTIGAGTALGAAAIALLWKALYAVAERKHSEERQTADGEADQETRSVEDDKSGSAKSLP